MSGRQPDSCIALGCLDGPEDGVQAQRLQIPTVSLSVHQHPCSVCGFPPPPSLPLRHHNGLVHEDRFCFC